MAQKTMHQLPAETIKLITSSQIITSVSTAVKELVENSLDADSRNIQVKLENYGFDVIEVKDDGIGVSYINVQRMFLPGCTSKITCFEDLGKLQSYGFRGEALSAIAKVSNVSITTKTSMDSLAMTYVINSDGIPESSKPSHITKGTIVTVTNLFKNLPVRKQFLLNKKKVAEELKKVEYVVQSLSVIHPELRINLIHNKCPIWQKNSVKGIKQSFMQVVGLKIVSRMEHINELANNILIDLIIPKKNLENIDNIFTNSNQNVFAYVNRRPVISSKIAKIVMEHIFLHYNKLNPNGKYATSFISVEVPSQEIDVNLEPNKTKVFLKNESEVINLIDHILSTYFEHSIKRGEKESDIENDRDEIKSEIEEEEEEDEEERGKENENENENHQKKRPRLEENESLKQVSSMRDKEFIDKNDGWHLQVIPVDTNEDFCNKKMKTSTANLCSQINKENCILTTGKEEGELVKLFHENSQKLITSVNLDSEIRSIDRNEIQSHDILKKNINQIEMSKQSSIATESCNEKLILADWPVRQIATCSAVETSNTLTAVEATNDVTETDKPNNNRADDAGGEPLGNIDLKNWSRGTLQDENGKLLCGTIVTRAELVNDSNFDISKSDIEQFDLSMRSVSSQMGKKELSAFTKFSRIMRSKILQEYPGIIFTKVAGLLVERWKALTSDEKKYYEKLSKVVDSERKLHQETKSSDSKVINLLPSKKKTTDASKKAKRREINIVASFEKVVDKRGMASKNISDDEIRLIGQLQPSGNWLYKKGNEIGHVRHHGLHELILYQKMLSNYSVPRQPMDRAISVNEETLGSELWEILIALEKEYDPLSRKYTVVSDVIAKNGFKIDLEEGQHGFECGWITELASMIPFYGVTELRETLALFRVKGQFADLGSLRTTAVINYITNEAIRIVHQMPRPPDFRDIKEWIDTWQLCLTYLPPQCLHCKDIFVPIYDSGKGLHT